MSRVPGMRRSSSVAVGLGICASLTACGPAAFDDAQGQVADLPVVEVVYETARDTADNVDSPAVWHGRAGEHWLLVTAKEGDVIQVLDARNGESLHRVGGSGTEPGQLERPNGIAVVDDLMVVVERDNARVQVFELPSFSPLGTFGEAELRLPYGVTIRRDGPGNYTAWITDAWGIEEDVVPPDSLLGDRVREYAFAIDDGNLVSRHVRAFGATSGPGVLHVVESLAVDVAGQRLLIAEEEEGDSQIMVYGIDGEFTGQIIPAEYFPYQAEGIVLYECGMTDGYWIATDQGEEVNTFHVFDRGSLSHRGSFRLAGVLNTDGITLTQQGFEGFPQGAFFAVHDDGNLAAVRWGDIAEAVGLREDCTLDVAHAKVFSR
ncbi:MAG: phytase [Gemmatimonas sp.]|nr:phytase [Gemmatimonas sp.]